MTTRNTTFFMADFAASDRRSVHAHLKGKSLRAKAFNTFTAVAKALGRGDCAADDFKAVSRFVFKRRDALNKLGKKLAGLATAVVGLSVGAGLFFLFVK